MLDEDDFALRRDRENADGGIGIWAADKVPATDAIEAEPAGFKKFFGSGHDVK